MKTISATTLIGLLLTLVWPGPVHGGMNSPFHDRFVIRNGQGLTWTVENGRIPYGHMLGPSAFYTMADGRLLITDTLNARLVRFSPGGSIEAELPLTDAARKAGLELPPLLFDLAVSRKRVLLADAANNRVLEVRSDGSLKTLVQSGTGEATFRQINRIFTTANGKLHLVDIATDQCLRYTDDGVPEMVFRGLHPCAPAGGNRLVQPVYSGNNKERTLEFTAADGKKNGVQTLIREAEPISYIQPLGCDSQGRIVLAYDSGSHRVYLRISADGTRRERVAMPLFDCGLDLTTPDWLGDDDRVYSVLFTPETLTIRQLQFPDAKD